MGFRYVQMIVAKKKKSKQITNASTLCSAKKVQQEGQPSFDRWPAGLTTQTHTTLLDHMYTIHAA